MSFIVITRDSQKGVVCPVNSMILRPFDVGTWSTITIGMFISGTTAASTNAAFSTQTIPFVNNGDWTLIGLKDSSANTPGFSGATFWGIGGAAAKLNVQLTSNGQGYWIQDGFNVRVVRFKDTTTTASAVIAPNGDNHLARLPYADHADFARFIGLRFIVNDIGLSTQTFDILRRVGAGGVGGSGATQAALETEMNSSFSSLITGHTANDGSVADTIPTALCIQWPFISARLIIHSMGVIKNA